METLFMSSGVVSPPPMFSPTLDPTPSHQLTVAPASALNSPRWAFVSSRFTFGNPLSYLFSSGRGRPRNGMAVGDPSLSTGAVADAVADEREEGESWVLKILHVRSLWGNDGQALDRDKEEEVVVVVDDDDDDEEEEEEEEDGCDGCSINYDEAEEKVEFDRESFSRLLRKVSLPQARLYAQMSYLGNLSYSIPDIKPGRLLKYRGLRFVTSSLKKRELGKELEKSRETTENQEEEKKALDEDTSKDEQQNGGGSRLSASAAFQIAASEASYLHSHVKSIVPFSSSRSNGDKDLVGVEGQINEGHNLLSSDVALLMATTDSVTAVVAAEDDVKQAVADDLKSTVSSPCEWFVCDDDESSTRFFVIQGSESLASWKTNLLFEPVQFEGFDIHVHRGIYEAAKGIYEQMLPELWEHLKAKGNKATFRFTGHSLGGSLSLLINLMLLIRGEVPAACLLPVITFGAPSVMCGGDRLLNKLGLPKSHVQSVTMHRDIVPRAFSCHYPGHVAEILKAVNGKFRTHSCLDNEKLLYAPMGELLILQPDADFSPHHHLLPLGSGLYVLTCQLSDVIDPEKHLQAAQKVFLSSPHPLEILSDRAAYGNGGTIQRDHDMNSYLRCVRGVIREELNRVRRVRREERRRLWWPIIASHGSIELGIAVRQAPSSSSPLGQRENLGFSGILQTGKESLRRFSRLVASQHMQLLVLILFPASLLLLGADHLL
ncbi:hypothetical protein MLD38_025109 [Melastoma candidum]|uniref:Uncharacterized protein n=1 Tax=Melastoma candidum TaxID=119954 RepID=A0ACB9P160_9MYRT|nr:hypothetical protein MLD38_025109 [Melastoma candidum]